MSRIIALFVIVAGSVAACADAQPAPYPPVPRPGPRGPYVSPRVDNLGEPSVRELTDGTLTMVHAPAELHLGTAYIALFVDDASGRPDAEAALCCWLYSAGEPDEGVRAFVQRVEPGRFLIQDLIFDETGRRELAVRVTRPGREDEVVYFNLEVGEMSPPEWPLSVPGSPHWRDSHTEVRPIPGGRLVMMHYPRTPSVGSMAFQFMVQTSRPEWLSLSTGLFRAGVGDFYDNLALRKQQDGLYTGHAWIPRPGLYLLRATLRPPGELGYTVQFELRVRR